VLFVNSVSVPPEHEKYCIDVSCPEHTRMHYVTRKSHWMQKQKISEMCPSVLFVEFVLAPPEDEN
jgi:hypothetical protein